MPNVAHIIRRRHARKLRKQAQSRRTTFWLALILGVPTLFSLLPLFGALALAFWLYVQAASTFPTTETLIVLDPEKDVTRFYDRSGETSIHTAVDPLGEERRWLSLEDLPKFVGDATLAAENQGHVISADFDPVHSMIRVWRYMLGVSLHDETGILGSLAQNTFLPNASASALDKSLLQVALIAEGKRRYSADELLELHLNTNYYGNDAFGIEAAARVYLGKTSANLSLADAVILAAIPPSPRQNPIDDQRGARQRQADLLLDLLNMGLIDQAAFDLASTESAGATIEKINRLPEIAPDFYLFARQQAKTILDNLGNDGARLMAGGGLHITTSLDLDLYFQAECVARAHLQQLNGGSSAVQTLQGSKCIATRELLPTARIDAAGPDRATLVILDVDSGVILSMLGNAPQVSRQPGVVLQPFIYIEGFLRRLYTPATMVYDIPQVYPGPADGLIYAPANPDGQFRGPLNLRDAMSAALVPPAVQVANSRGMEQVIRTAHRLGFNSLDANRVNLDILERGGAVSVLDVGYAYGVLAATGVMRGLPAEPIAAGFRGRDPVAILRITDADGNVLWEYEGAQGRSNETPVIEPSLAYLVNDVLADEATRQRVLDRADEGLQVAQPAAVVDGLSADRRDSWTIGYTPRFVVAVNVARADGAAMDLEHYGRSGSAPIWRALMDHMTDRDNLPERDWPTPVDIEEFLVCEISGQLPPVTDHCPTRREIVPAGSPLRRDTLWQTVEINSLTGQLATVTTPDNQRRKAAYFVPPDKIMDWWIADGRPLPPSTYGSDGDSDELPVAQLIQPSGFAYVGGIVEITGSINEPGTLYYVLEYGAGVNPREWIQIARESTEAAPTDLGVAWDTTELHGVYTLKLTALTDDGRTITDTRQVTLDNTPPTIELRTGDGAFKAKYPSEQVISLLADASDNLSIDRVEFYQGSELLGVDREWPYGFEYEILGTGTVNFVALAFDQVGNSADSVFLATIEEG